MKIKKATSNASPFKILVIGPSWVGDMVMAQSLFIVLKQQHPEAIIDVLAPAWSRPIIERMPEINNAIDMPLGHGHFGFQDRRKLGHQLRKEDYDQAIILPNSWKSALIPWFANIPVRTGWVGEARYFLLNDWRKLNKQQLPMMVQRFIALAHDKNDSGNPSKTSLDHCPPPRLSIDPKYLPGLLSKLELHQKKPILILCPGAEFGPAKQWPADHYRTIAATMMEQGWQVWVMGSKADHSIAEEITESIASSDIVNLCGQTTLEEAIDLIAAGDHVVSNDSGLMHIASALNKPLTALYGATSPKFTPPLSANATIIATDIECGPCFQRHCPEGHHKCMKELTPQQVLKTLEKV